MPSMRKVRANWKRWYKYGLKLERVTSGAQLATPGMLHAYNMVAMMERRRDQKRERTI